MKNNFKGGIKPDIESKPKKILKIGAAIFLAALVIIGGVFGYLYIEANSIIDNFSSGEKEKVVEAAKEELGQDPLNQFPGLRNTKTYILLGYDVRTAIKPDDPGRTDTILMVRIYPEKNMASVLSLPRDMYVPIPGYGDDRINAAYTYGGIPLLVKTIREWTGVKIDHFVQIGFTSFIDLVNDLNGAYIPVDQRYYNDGSNGYMAIDLKPGYQRLEGEDALEFVRFRSADSDFYRASRQQIFIREVGRALREKNTSIQDYKNLIEIISKQTTSDMQSLPQLLNLANTLRKIPSENIVRSSMGGASNTIGGMSVVTPSEAEKEQAIYDWDHPEKFINQQEKIKPSKMTIADKLDLVRFIEITATIDKKIKTAKRANILKRGIVQRSLSQKSRKASVSSIAEVSSLMIEATAPVSGESQQMKHCVPVKIPSGYYWPSDSVHEYRLNKTPALASYLTAGSGRSALFMWTKWKNPIILRRPSDLLRIPGDRRIYRLYWESGKVRMIAWQDGNTMSWITNTLQNELDKKTMIALASNCQI